MRDFDVQKIGVACDPVPMHFFIHFRLNRSISLLNKGSASVQKFEGLEAVAMTMENRFFNAFGAKTLNLI